MLSSPIHKPAQALILFLLLLSYIFAVTDCHGTIQKDSSANTRSAQQYQNAKDYYYTLERDAAIGHERSNWLNGIRKFRRIYLEDPKGELAPSCLYMMGRMQYKMHQRFHLPIDLEDSIGYYNDVARIFSTNTLADDALFNVGEIFLLIEKKYHKAADQFLQIIKLYPDGDKYAQAVNKLKFLEKHHNIPVPEALTKNKKLSKLIKVLPVKYWSSKDYTRVVIRATSPVHFTSQLLKENKGQPRRLYIDFNQSHIPPRFRQPVPIQDGLLKQVRTGQFSPSTVRVVLDMESVSDYKIFSLNDPFRVVIDVNGSKKAQKPHKVLPSANKKTAVVVMNKQDQGASLPASESSGKTKKFTRSAAHPFITLKETKKKSVQSVKEDNSIQAALTDSYSLAQQLGLGVRKIIIDPGHGGKDPGAVAFGLKEKNLVLAISKQLAAILRAKYGYEVKLTRTDDTFIPLEERTAIANTEQADLFVSVHINAHPNASVRGIETYYLNLATNAEAMRVAAFENATSTHNIGELQDILSSLMQNSKINESSRLAEYVHTNLISGLKSSSYPIHDLGVKQAPFYVLLGAEMPAILCELSFLTNKEEAMRLKTPTYQTKAARQIAKGIIAYVNRHKSVSLHSK